jgi:hypothetical protein
VAHLSDVSAGVGLLNQTANDIVKERAKQVALISTQCCKR